MKKDQAKHAKTFQGVVVSDKMDKTVVVLVNRYVKQPKYGKFQQISKRYKAHDEKNECHVGDKVVIVETTPISKDKTFAIHEVISKAVTA
jgi:small subunit ribosomal protein S17